MADNEDRVEATALYLPFSDVLTLHLNREDAEYLAEVLYDLRVDEGDLRAGDISQAITDAIEAGKVGG